MTTVFFMIVFVIVAFAVLSYDKPEPRNKDTDIETYRDKATDIVNTERSKQKKGRRSQNDPSFDHTSVYGGYIAGSSSSSSSDYSGSSSGGCGGSSSSSGGDSGGCL